MRRSGRQVAEIVFALAMLALSASIWWAARDLPPAMLEPIGPAAFPRAASVMTAVLALIVLVAAVVAPAAPSRPGATHRKRSALALVMLALTVAYLAAMEAEISGYRDATVVYLLALGLTLFDFDWRRLPHVAAIALIVGVGTHYVFTGMFFIDLP